MSGSSEHQGTHGSESNAPSSGTKRTDAGTIGSGFGGSTGSGRGGATGVGGTARASGPVMASGFGPGAGFASSGLSRGDRITLNGVDYTYDGVVSKSSGEAEIFLLHLLGAPFVFKLYNSNFKPKVEILAKLKSLSHKDIVNVLDYGYFQDRFFEIMEYAEGGTLEQYLPVKDLKRLRSILVETLGAFEFCHSHGIIHRDIKPSNIYCRKADGNDIVIGDFGISSSLDEGMLQRLTSQNLTEGYAAPELYGIDGKVIIGREVDYYALGITLIHLWDGKSPFQGLTRWSISNLTISGAVPVPNDLPEEWQSLIRGLITIDYTKRWSLDEVHRWLRGEKVPVHHHVKQFSYPPFQFDVRRTADSPAALAHLLKQYQEQGRKQLYSGKASAWVYLFDQRLAALLDVIVEMEYPKDKDAGLHRAIYLLDPDEPLNLGRDCRTSAEIAAALEEGFAVYQVLLATPTSPFYLYLEAHEAQKEADAFRAMFRTFSAKRALNTIILELAGRQSVMIGGRTFTRAEDVLQARGQAEIVDMLKDPESKLSLWMDSAASQIVKEQLAAWRALKISDATTLAYVSASGGGVPQIELSPHSIDLTDLKTRTTVASSFEVHNKGQGSLSGTITVNKPWIKLKQSKVDPAKKSQTIEFTVDTAGMPYGATDAATIEVQSNVGTEVVSVSVAIEQGTRAIARFRNLMTVGAAAVGAALGLLIAEVSARTGSDLSALARVLSSLGIALIALRISHEKGGSYLLMFGIIWPATFVALTLIQAVDVQAALTWALLLAVGAWAVAPFVMRQTLRTTNNVIAPVLTAIATLAGVGGVIFGNQYFIESLDPEFLSSVGTPSRSEFKRERNTSSVEDSQLITSSSIGAIRLGMTLDQAKRKLHSAKLERMAGADGLALVVVKKGDDDQFYIHAEEPDPDAPIQWNATISVMETFNPSYRTAEGVHPGSSIYDVAKIYGPIVEASISEIESREYITFANQPEGLTFRLNHTGIYSANSRRTTKFSPGAQILGIQTDYRMAR